MKKTRKKPKRRRSVFEALRKGNMFHPRTSDAVMNRMVEHHLDVLQNIEFTILEMYHNDEYLDDKIVADALDALLRRREPSHPVTCLLAEELQDMRFARSDVDDSIWNDGLRVVLDSVHRHSDRRPGDTDYLDFIDSVTSF